ncbi:MAG: YbhB/YbcL family Raf kinase inhibitor-like protein [Acidimicrobiia bacterium]|nr:YbhB/YbcL family Raf kinase inhibitor-like protein [Acidimicrobiia bacterium]
MRNKTLVALIVTLAGLSTVAVGCADDGRELAEPADWQTTTTRPPPPTSALDQEASPTGVTLSSPDFQPGTNIPASATCAGDNIFPNLEWSTIPGGTAELAVTLSDQTDPSEPLLLWLMAGIEPDRSGLQAGFIPEGAFETLNDYGNLGYGTPCLESFASGRRDLQFRLYVLTQPSGLQSGDPGNEAWATLRAQATETASLLARVDSQA